MVSHRPRGISIETHLIVIVAVVVPSVIPAPVVRVVPVLHSVLVVVFGLVPTGVLHTTTAFIVGTLFQLSANHDLAS